MRTKRQSHFARDFMIPSRSTAPGFSQDDRQTEKDNHKLALSLFVSCRSFTRACTFYATEGERLPPVILYYFLAHRWQLNSLRKVLLQSFLRYEKSLFEARMSISFNILINLSTENVQI